MKYDEEKECYKLDNGDLINAMYGYGDYCLTEGCFHRNDREFTPDERKEIAEYMTQLWKEWAE